MVGDSIVTPLQLCPIWICNNVQKYFATMSKKCLQKTKQFYKNISKDIAYIEKKHTNFFRTYIKIVDNQCFIIKVRLHYGTF